MSAKTSKRNWTNQEAFLRVQRSGAFRGKNLAKNQNFLTFGQWARKCRFLGEVFLKGLSTPHSICPEKSFETKVFFSKKKSKFDILFWIRMKKFRICGRSFQQGCQRQNSRDQRKFLVKFCLDEHTTLNLLMVFVRKICFAENSRFVSKAFYANSGTFSGTKFWRNKTFLTFGHWAKIFWVSGKINLAELPKLHSMCAEQLLE